MIGNNHLDRLVGEAPVNFDSAKVEWDGIRNLLADQHVDPSSVVAVTWCSFGVMNIEALVDSAALTLIHPGGVLSSAGKRKKFGNALKFNQIIFTDCRNISDAEHTDERGLGKYCIEFSGPGGVLLGRLQWAWRAKRLRDSRAEIMAVARERDRIFQVIRDLTN